jgi:hypothetical protein
MGFARTINDMPPMDAGSSDHHHSDNQWPREFFIPVSDLGSKHSRRLLFLDGAGGFGLGFWLHSHFVRHTKTWVKETCLKRNGFADNCPLCDHQEMYVDKKTGEEKTKIWYPDYVGSLTIIMLGTPENYRADGGKLKTKINPLVREYKGKEYFTSFERMNLLLRRGSEKYPKALTHVHDLVSQQTGAEVPNLQGLIMDTYRSDDKSDNVGDSWSLITRNDEPWRITPDKYLDYLKYMGAPDSFDVTQLEPMDHEQRWAPKSYMELREILDNANGMTKASGQGYEGPRQPVAPQGAGYDEGPQYGSEDDLPF